jgi:hypothetical protein
LQKQNQKKISKTLTNYQKSLATSEHYKLQLLLVVIIEHYWFLAVIDFSMICRVFVVERKITMNTPKKHQNIDEP